MKMKLIGISICFLCCLLLPVMTSAQMENSHGDVEYPASFALIQNYPNPFNASMAIEFALPQRAFVRIDIYNAVGQSVSTLIDGPVSSGRHQILWDGMTDSGRAAISANNVVAVKKGILLKSRHTTASFRVRKKAGGRIGHANPSANWHHEVRFITGGYSHFRGEKIDVVYNMLINVIDDIF